jgi:hypothetical protein
MPSAEPFHSIRVVFNKYFSIVCDCVESSNMVALERRSLMEYSGQVVRIVPSMGMVYLATADTGKVFSFRLDRLEGYRGESLGKCGIKLGALVAFRTNRDGLVLSVARPGQSLIKAGLAARAAN